MIFSKFVPSSSASIEGVGNILPIKTSRNDDRVKYGFSIVFYHSQSVHTRRLDIYAATDKCGARNKSNIELMLLAVILGNHEKSRSKDPNVPLYRFSVKK